MSRILFLSHTHRGGVFTVGSHHLSRELAAQGHEVAHVSSPVSALHLVKNIAPERRRAAFMGPTRSQDGVIDYVPLTLLPAHWRWTRRSLSRVVRRIGFETVDYCFIDQPLLAARLPEGTITVFRPTDIKSRQIDIERAAFVMGELAHGLVATSPLVADSLPNPRNLAMTTIENGCETTLFASRSGTFPRHGFVYVGALDDRFDLDAVLTLAAAFPEEPVDVYGPSNEKLVAAASGMPNLSVHGAIPYEAVPGVLARARVGLLPFTRTALNRGRSPMKLYEYLAAGLAVLTSEPVRTDGPVAEVTFSYEDMDDMRRAAARALQADASGEPIRQFVATKDWASNAQQLMEFAVGLRAIADGATR